MVVSTMKVFLLVLCFHSASNLIARSFWNDTLYLACVLSMAFNYLFFFFFKQKTAYEISGVTGVQTCALPISTRRSSDLKQKTAYEFSGVTGVQTCALPIDRKSTRLNSSHSGESRMPSSA